MEVEPFIKPDWHQRTRAFGRRALRTLLRDLVVLMVLAGLGEGAVRLFVPSTGRLRFTPTVTGGHPKTLNSLGLRDVEFAAERPPEQIRVLCMGNSTTFGAGVGMQAAYPKQFERLLNERCNADPYFVINGSTEGSSLDKAVEFLTDEGLGYDPSLVVLGYSPSMMALGPPADGAAPEGQQPTDARSPLLQARIKHALRVAAVRVHGRLYGSYLYVFLDANVRRRLYRLGVLRDRMDKPTGAIFAYAFDDPGVDLEHAEAAYRRFREGLIEIQALLRQRGIPFVVLGIPSRFDCSDDPIDNERGFETRRIRIQPLDRVGQYCREAGIPFVDLRVRFRTERRAMFAGTRPWDDLYIPLDFAHLNETGLSIAAEELMKVIDEEGLVPPRPS